VRTRKFCSSTRRGSPEVESFQIFRSYADNGNTKRVMNLSTQDGPAMSPPLSYLIEKIVNGAGRQPERNTFNAHLTFRT
jgi:hypothetical protein